MLRIDLHCHTSHSYDGWTTPLDVVRAARQAGLDRICITDHGNISGALEAREHAPEMIIPGIEIRCAGGTELIGIWVTAAVPDGLTTSETAARLRDQGAIVYAPHPFAYPRNARSHARCALVEADIVEVYNPRAFYPGWNRAAAVAAADAGLPVAASSDAHFPWEIGHGYTEVPPFRTPDELLESVRSGRPIAAGRSNPASHILSIGLGMLRGMRARS